MTALLGGGQVIRSAGARREAGLPRPCATAHDATADRPDGDTPGRTAAPTPHHIRRGAADRMTDESLDAIIRGDDGIHWCTGPDLCDLI